MRENPGNLNPEKNKESLWGEINGISSPLRGKLDGVSSEDSENPDQEENRSIKNKPDINKIGFYRFGKFDSSEITLDIFENLNSQNEIYKRLISSSNSYLAYLEKNPDKVGLAISFFIFPRFQIQLHKKLKRSKIQRFNLLSVN